MKLSVIFLALLSFKALAAIEIKSAPSQGSVNFEAVGRPAMLKIKGSGEGATSNLVFEKNLVSGTIKFNLASLKTGIDLRDEHMKEKYLEVSQHPSATLTFKNQPLPAAWNPKSPETGKMVFRGHLSLHGVIKPVAGYFSINNAALGTTANFAIKLSDFAIEIPSYLGIKVADIVKINVNFSKMQVTALQ